MQGPNTWSSRTPEIVSRPVHRGPCSTMAEPEGTMISERWAKLWVVCPCTSPSCLGHSGRHRRKLEKDDPQKVALLISTCSAAATSFPHANTGRRQAACSSLLAHRLPRSNSSSRSLQLMVFSLTCTRWCPPPSLESPFAAREFLLGCIFSCTLRWEEKGLFRECFVQRQITLHGGSGIWRSSRLSGCVEMQWEMLRGRGSWAVWRARPFALCLEGPDVHGFALHRGITSWQRMSKLALTRT